MPYEIAQFHGAQQVSWIPPTRAPEFCREPKCAHLEELGDGAGRHDRCLRYKPMHEGCQWHETPEQLRARVEREGRC